MAEPHDPHHSPSRTACSSNHPISGQQEQKQEQLDSHRHHHQNPCEQLLMDDSDEGVNLRDRQEDCWGGGNSCGGEEGSQLLDDSRSWCSQKSDAGYLSSGALSDGGTGERGRSSGGGGSGSNMGTGGGGTGSRDQHNYYNSTSSMRSVGSVGSQESGGGGSTERYSKNSNSGYYIRQHSLHVAATHIMNDETRFPTAMSYVSDAQRSDVATVCSGSITEDIEVESVLSQEDHPQHVAAATLHSSATTNFHPYQSLSEKASAVRTSSRGYSGSNRVVDFADAPLQQHPTDLAVTVSANVLPRKGGTLTITQPALHPALQNQSKLLSAATERVSQILPIHNMGPPLSRALLLQKSEGSSSRAGSVKSFGSANGSDAAAHCHSDDCGGSLDVETQSVHSQDDPGNVESTCDGDVDVSMMSKDQTSESAPQSKMLSSQAGGFSVKSFGSYAGSDKADTDDCGGSLDVETHSLETRSIHSQDDAPTSVEMADATSAACGAGIHSDAPLSSAEDDNSNQLSSNNPLLTSEPVESGRRSPGGTIYKGRGVRRYQGRYMHLPLKRFHQNGVHLDSVDEQGASLQILDQQEVLHQQDELSDDPIPDHHDDTVAFSNGFCSRNDDQHHTINGFLNGVDVNNYSNGMHVNGFSKRPADSPVLVSKRTNGFHHHGTNGKHDDGVGPKNDSLDASNDRRRRREWEHEPSPNSRRKYDGRNSALPTRRGRPANGFHHRSNNNNSSSSANKRARSRSRSRSPTHLQSDRDEHADRLNSSNNGNSNSNNNNMAMRTDDDIDDQDRKPRARQRGTSPGAVNGFHGSSSKHRSARGERNGRRHNHRNGDSNGSGNHNSHHHRR